MGFFSHELVQKHIQRATDSALEDLREQIDDTISVTFGWMETHPETPQLESPLEAVFLAWFTAYQVGSYYRTTIEHQYWVNVGDERFRADFAVWGKEIGRNPVLVELDGHAFHEKTLEQVELRNRRDRALQTAGYRVLHFSFSEMTSKPRWCVDEVIIAVRAEFYPESMGGLR